MERKNPFEFMFLTLLKTEHTHKHITQDK